MRSAFAGKSRRSPALFVIVHARARVTGRKNVCIWPRSDWNQTPGPCIMQDLELIALGGAWLSSTRAGEADGAKKYGGAGPEQNFSSIGRQRHGKAIHSCALDDFA